jgi:4-amino-4-deoxy-L-arabinose transferase-like glycosyltransferase
MIAPDPMRWQRLLVLAVLLFALGLRVAGLGYYPFKDECQLALSALLMDVLGTIDPPVPNWPPLLYYLQIGCLKSLQLVGLMPASDELLLHLVRTGHLQVGPLHWLLRGMAVGIGMGGVVLLLWFARSLHGLAMAVAASLFLAVSWLHVAYSHFPLTDALVGLLVLASVGVSALAVERERRRWLWGAAFLAGVAVGAKYFGGLAVVAALGGLWELDRRAARPWRATWLAAVSLGLPLALGCFLAMPGLPFHPQGYLSWLSRHASDMGDGWPGFEASSRGWIHALTSTLRWGLSGAHLEILALLGMIGPGGNVRCAAPCCGFWLAGGWWSAPPACNSDATGCRSCRSCAGRQRWACATCASGSCRGRCGCRLGCWRSLW